MRCAARVVLPTLKEVHSRQCLNNARAGTGNSRQADDHGADRLPAIKHEGLHQLAVPIEPVLLINAKQVQALDRDSLHAARPLVRAVWTLWHGGACLPSLWMSWQSPSQRRRNIGLPQRQFIQRVREGVNLVVVCAGRKRANLIQKDGVPLSPHQLYVPRLRLR